MRRSLIIAVLLMAIATASHARTKPPTFELPPLPDTSISVDADSLCVLPTKEASYLRFTGNVVCVGEGIRLKADLLEMEILQPEDQQLDFELPTLPDNQRVVEEPGDTIAAMARELELPRPKFSANSIRRIGAQGNVVVESDFARLATNDLVSVDGGRSWSTESRTTITGTDPETQSEFRLGADNLLFDTATKRALARGEITGWFQRPGGEPVDIRTERLEVDMNTSELMISEYMLVTYMGFSICCGSLTANLQDGTAVATDSPRAGKPDEGITAEMGQIAFDWEKQTITATGGITIRDDVRGLMLEAGKLDGDLEAMTVVASGNPVVTSQAGTYTGERIRLTVGADDHIIIEVEGDQSARIDVDLAQQLTKKPAEPAE